MPLTRSLAGLVALSSLVALPAYAAAPRDECAATAESAQELRKQQKLTDAREALLACAREACPRAVRTDCRTWLAEVESELPTMVVRARSGGRDVDVGRIFVDGRPRGDLGGGVPFPLDPGSHDVTLETPAGRASPERVVAVVGEKNRLVTFEVAAPPAPPAPAPAAPRPRTIGAPVLAAAGVGALGLVAFGALQLVARVRLSDLEDGCGRTRTCDEDARSGVSTWFAASGVALGISAAALVASGVLFALDARPARIAIGPGAVRATF